ncbi:MAG TPA: hypothetical protein VHX88_05245 [Solirubrobacteraceae bacterium]|nr:hypothetical protein [Solirubrobacteraceae bacterium]
MTARLVSAGALVSALALAGCGSSSSPEHVSSRTSTSTATVRTSATTPAATAPAARTVSFPPAIGAYALIDPKTGHAGTRATSDDGFTKSFPDAQDADTAPYVQHGNPTPSGLITVTAGALQAGVSPAAAVSGYFTEATHTGGSAADLTTEPAGTLGGAASCWYTLPFASTPSLDECMWADAATYGLLIWEPSKANDMSHLAGVLVTFRSAMERAAT